MARPVVPPPDPPWVEVWVTGEERLLLDPAELETLAAQRYGDAHAKWSAAAADAPDRPICVVATLADLPQPLEPPSRDLRAMRGYILTERALWRDGHPL